MGKGRREEEENLREWGGRNGERTDKENKGRDILIEVFVFLKYNLLFHES